MLLHFENPDQLQLGRCYIVWERLGKPKGRNCMFTVWNCLQSLKHDWWIAFSFEIKNKLERREKKEAQWEYKPNFRMRTEATRLKTIEPDMFHPS